MGRGPKAGQGVGWIGQSAAGCRRDVEREAAMDSQMDPRAFKCRVEAEAFNKALRLLMRTRTLVAYERWSSFMD